MKKVLMWLGAILLLLILGFGGLLLWAYRSGAEQQQRFFDAIASGDPRRAGVRWAWMIDRR
jgi:hypothetical protein